MASTRTGSFPIGFRTLRSDWHQDIDALIAWAVANDFESIDLRTPTARDIEALTDAGLQVGAIDMKWHGLISPQASTRDEAVHANVSFIQDCHAAGASRFMTVLIPDDFDQSRSDNLDWAIESYSRIVESVQDLGVVIGVEGWPGPPPLFPCLGCHPADCRVLMVAIPNATFGINYDPSHLVRMGVDHVRFIDEFADRVVHVHAKDTEIDDDAVYEFGTTQPRSRGGNRRYTGEYWRYTLPGHGPVRWSRVLQALVAAGFDGLVSIELEDIDCLGNREDEERALFVSRAFLASV